jgi:hypothetical protein
LAVLLKYTPAMTRTAPITSDMVKGSFKIKNERKFHPRKQSLILV